MISGLTLLDIKIETYCWGNIYIYYAGGTHALKYYSGRAGNSNNTVKFLVLFLFLWGPGVQDMMAPEPKTGDRVS